MGGVGEKRRLQKSYFDVLGICCSSEIPLIEKILKPLEGVKDVSVIVASRTVIVVHDSLVISQLEIAKLLNEARLEANLRVYGGGNEGKYKNRWPSPYAIACGILLSLSFLKYVFQPMQWLAIGAVAIGICPIFLKAVSAVRNRTIDTNILMLIAVIGSIALRDYWEAGTIVFLFTIAQWLEARASHKATAVMSSLMNIVPQKAVIAETGEEVDAGEVKVNTVLAVKAGQFIPIDGIVVDGRCEVDEKTLTGEPFLVSKQVDSIVWAGTINFNGYISVKTTALAEDCVVAKMATLVEEAQNSKTETQRLIDKCAKYYTPAVVLISAGLATVPAILRVHNLNHWLHLSLVVLVSACPCALILSTPVATFCALSKAATSGLLIKGGEYIETLSKIKIIGFDKTGTVTKGEFSVADFRSLTKDVPLNTLLHWVSSIESKSSHPMAAALVDYGRLHSIEPMPEEVEEFENFPGEGIHGKIEGKDVFIGNRRIALRANCPQVPELGGITSGGKSIGYIFLGPTPAGVFSLSDSCRTGVKEAMNQLKSMHVKIAMLTGDSNESANLVQSQLEGAFDVVHAELLPQDKARIVKEFQKEGPTAMVGDGLNDTPALATADIGISMGISGSALATETGQVILMSNDIRKIPEAVGLARKTVRTIIENVILSITTKVAIIALAFAGYPLVWAAVLADVGTCLVVIINSMFILRVKHKHGKKEHNHRKGGHESHGCHSAHSHHHGCSDNKSQMNSKLQKCCSKKGSSKCHSTAANIKASSAHEHKHPKVNNSGAHQQKHIQEKGCCAQEHKIQEVVCSSYEHKHQESGHNHKQEGSPAHNHQQSSCCAQKLSEEVIPSSHGSQSSISQEAMHLKHKQDHQESGCCAHKHKHSEEAMHFDHESCTTSMEGHAKSTLNHTDRNNSQCCIADEEQGNVHQSCCKPQDVIPEGSNGSCNNNAGCQSFKKKEIGGCCSSYRKECCARSENFGAVSLTEIIVE